MKKYLNLGCGKHYSENKEWTNLDFVSHSTHVIQHNLLAGVPFEDNSFDLVYHSHVLEHFNEDDGKAFMKECIRVLKPGGVVRIAIPDLEKIVREYLLTLEKGIENSEDEITFANYKWIMMEMFDQSVRNHSGGKMATLILDPLLKNEQYILDRIGDEGRQIKYPDKISILPNNSKEKSSLKGKIILYLRIRIRKLALYALGINENVVRIGKFRSEGEIHQWMYDRYSVLILLKSLGTKNIVKRDAFTSYIDNWKMYNLDGKNGVIRKPDSLFMESIK